ncbi:MAG: hypothetical protein FK734_16580 [Asgard group archaeon]|nr:hypothetical protein [Asgard group archaeon]
MAEINPVWYIVGITVIFVIVVAVILWDQIRNYRKKGALDSSSAHASPSSFNAESKTKMMSTLDKRESQIRRERILEGGTLPELSEIVVYSPTMNERITTPEIDIRGKTAIHSLVWVNNQAAFVDVDGSFIGTIRLYRGKNQIDIFVVGPYGNTLQSKLVINCTSKDAPTPSSASPSYLLPDRTLEIHTDDIAASMSRSDESLTAIKDKTVKRKKPDTAEIMYENAVVSERYDDPSVDASEIDPSILAALKGDPFSEETLTIESPIEITEIEPEGFTPEISEDQIPPIPDIDEIEIEDKIPPVPDVNLQDDKIETSPTELDNEQEIDESIKILEETISEDKDFQPDKMIPKQPGEKISSEEDIDDISLDDFQPLRQSKEDTSKLEVKTKLQKLDDEFSTTIIQHNGFIKQEDNELIQVLKVEKRIKNDKQGWTSTLGIVNITDTPISELVLKEYISNTIDTNIIKKPENAHDPIIKQLPEGVSITWVINNLKPHKTIIIEYFEKVNPTDLLLKDQLTAEMTIRN